MGLPIFFNAMPPSLDVCCHSLPRLMEKADGFGPLRRRLFYYEPLPYFRQAVWRNEKAYL